MTTELIASSQTPIARMDDLSKLRPDRLLHSINRALELGYDYEDIAKDARFQAGIEHLLREFEVRQQMFAPSSQRRLQQGWKMFVCWCEQTNKQPLPASPAMIEQYLLLRGEQFHRNTLNVDRWAISTIHQAAGCPDPTRDLIVRQTMRVIVKKKVRVNNEKVKQAPPFRDSDLDVLTSIWKDSDYIPSLRNLALMTVAYETLLRSQELANMKLEHIIPLANGGASVEIPFTKTNQSGDGAEYSYLSPEAISVLNTYLDKAGIENDGGYVFRPISKFGRVREPKKLPLSEELVHIPINTKSVEDVFLKSWFALNPGVDSTQPLKDLKKQYRIFTAHSARVGAAQDLLEQGYSSLQVRQAGRWKSDTMVSRYAQHILVENSAMAQSRRNKAGKA